MGISSRKKLTGQTDKRDIEFLTVWTMGPAYQKMKQASTISALPPFYQDKGRCKPFPAGVCRVFLVQTEQKGQQLAGGNVSP